MKKFLLILLSLISSFFLGTTYVKAEELHHLRPYPAQPMNTAKTELSLLCGNDLIASDTVIGTYRYGDSNCLPIGGGKVRCSYNLTKTKEVRIDLTDADLPIMG